MNTKFKRITAIIFTGIIIAFLCFSFLFNLKSGTEPFKKFKNGDIEFSELIAQVKKSYVSNVKGKNSYININGLFARITGRNHYNEVARLKNGMITYGQRISYDMQFFGNGLTEFNAYLKNNGIDYLYVQAPFKVDVGETLLYEGTVNYANDDANELLSILEKNSVPYIDLRQDMSSNKEQVEKYFYNTDHHWNNEAAFYAFGVLMKQLNEKYPDANIDMSVTNKENWNVKVYENALLGSHGRRVGKLYAGVDDYHLYTPKFETSNMSLYVPKYKNYYEGSFEDALVVRKDFIENYDLFNEDPYSVYMGGHFPIVHHRNANASSDLKILLVKDSFSNPVECFMSTAFKEIDALDVRNFNECSVAEYIEATKPDVVITFINPSSFAYKQYASMGTDKAVEQGKKVNESIVKEAEKLTLNAPAESNYVHNVLVNKANFNTKYKITFDDVEFLAGDSECITVALYNSTTKQFVSNCALDVDYLRQNGGFEWTIVSPEKGNDNLQILIYAGRHGQTGGNSVSFTNLKVVKYS